MKIRKKTLEYISRYIGDNSTGYELIDFLKGCGVSPEIIVYPNTKWRMVNDVLTNLSESGSEENQKVLTKIIEEFLHPLNFGGDEGRTREAIKIFNNWLKFDDLEIHYYDRKAHLQKYISEQESDDAMIEAVESDFEKTVKKIKKDNLDDVILLKKSYQTLMGVVDAFFDKHLEPDEKLNEIYIKLVNIVRDTVNKLRSLAIEGCPYDWILPFAYIPFRNLYAAQAESHELILGGPKDVVIKEKQYLGSILDLAVKCDAGDISTDTDAQKFLNEISLYLTSLKQEKVGVIRSAGKIGGPILWEENFKWNNDVFEFGEIGEIGFTSSDRKKLFESLTNAEGNWVTVKKLIANTEKNEKYVRSTIQQIEERMAPKLKRFVDIPSTQDDQAGEVPAEAAYRIRYKKPEQS